MSLDDFIHRKNVQISNKRSGAQPVAMQDARLKISAQTNGVDARQRLQQKRNLVGGATGAGGTASLTDARQKLGRRGQQTMDARLMIDAKRGRVDARATIMRKRTGQAWLPGNEAVVMAPGKQLLKTVSGVLTMAGSNAGVLPAKTIRNDAAADQLAFSRVRPLVEMSGNSIQVTSVNNAPKLSEFSEGVQPLMSHKPTVLMDGDNLIRIASNNPATLWSMPKQNNEVIPEPRCTIVNDNYRPVSAGDWQQAGGPLASPWQPQQPQQQQGWQQQQTWQPQPQQSQLQQQNWQQQQQQQQPDWQPQQQQQQQQQRQPFQQPQMVWQEPWQQQPLQQQLQQPQQRQQQQKQQQQNRLQVQQQNRLQQQHQQQQRVQRQELHMQRQQLQGKFDRQPQPNFVDTSPEQDVDDVEMFDEELEDEWTSPSQNNNRPMNVRQPPLKTFGGGANAAAQGSRVFITNLDVTVTQDDIVELFGEVGVLKWARLLHPGAAEVIFVSRDDAVMATRKYHQRELDGMPMHVRLSVAGGGVAAGRVKRAPAPRITAPRVAAPSPAGRVRLAPARPFTAPPARRQLPVRLAPARVRTPLAPRITPPARLSGASRLRPPLAAAAAARLKPPPQASRLKPPPQAGRLRPAPASAQQAKKTVSPPATSPPVCYEPLRLSKASLSATVDNVVSPNTVEQSIVHRALFKTALKDDPANRRVRFTVKI